MGRFLVATILALSISPIAMAGATPRTVSLTNALWVFVSSKDAAGLLHDGTVLRFTSQSRSNTVLRVAGFLDVYRNGNYTAFVSVKGQYHIATRQLIFTAFKVIEFRPNMLKNDHVELAHYTATLDYNHEKITNGRWKTIRSGRPFGTGEWSAKRIAYLDTIGEDMLARRFLRYIKRQARMRATRTADTVECSRFVHYLQKKFLRDYLKEPTDDTARCALTTIGKAQSGITWYSAIYIPLFLRNKLGVKVLYPATEWYRRGGAYYEDVPYMDVPFLLGPAEPKGLNDEHDPYSGNNSSNTMHWATGVKYAGLDAEGMRQAFVAYELWHLEGWDRFGDDSINDLIAEEQGRLFGKLILAKKVSVDNLVASCDEAFREARAWVGAVLRMRQDELDAQLLGLYVPPAQIWWNPKDVRWVSPFVSMDSSIKGQLRRIFRCNPDIHSKRVIVRMKKIALFDGIIDIYRLIYESSEWEKLNGRKMKLSCLTADMARNYYNHQFRRASKNYAWVGYLRGISYDLVPNDRLTPGEVTVQNK